MARWITIGALVGVTACSPQAAAPADAGPPPEAALIVTGADRSVSLLGPAGATTIIADSLPGGVSIQPTPAPGGDAVIFTGSGKDDEVVAVVWAAGTVTEIDFGFAPFYYQWSPNGERVVALGNGSSGVAAAIASRDGSELVRLGSDTPYFLSWSPDGGRIATHRGGEGLAVVDLDGSASPLGARPGAFQAPEWINDHQLIVVAEGSSLEASTTPATKDLARLVIADIDGTTTELAPLGAAGHFSYDPVSDRLAVIDGDSASERLRIIDMATGDARELATEPVLAMEWSPDGTRLLTFVVRDRQLVPQVWVDATMEAEYPPFEPSQTFLTEYLQFWGQYMRSVQLWAPSSDEFVYATVEDEIVSQSLGSEPQVVSEGVMAQWTSPPA